RRCTGAPQSRCSTSGPGRPKRPRARRSTPRSSCSLLRRVQRPQTTGESPDPGRTDFPSCERCLRRGGVPAVRVKKLRFTRVFRGGRAEPLVLWGLEGTRRKKGRSGGAAPWVKPRKKCLSGGRGR